MGLAAMERRRPQYAQCCYRELPVCHRQKWMAEMAAAVERRRSRLRGPPTSSCEIEPHGTKGIHREMDMDPLGLGLGETGPPRTQLKIN